MEAESAITLRDAELELEPWVRLFKDSYYKHWVPSYGYATGQDAGTCTLEVVVERSGRVSRVMVVDASCSQDLQRASVRTVKALSGKVPLPEDFAPEDLTMVVRLNYPRIHR